VPADAPDYAQPDVVAGDVGLADAIFITAARNALPSLLASLRASREREARLTVAMRAALDYIEGRDRQSAACVLRLALVADTTDRAGR